MFSDFVQFVREIYDSDGYIPLHAPRFHGKEKSYVLEAIESTFVSSVGQYVDKFEQDIAKYTGAEFAVATVSGTSALHIALLMSGVSAGDEVITQPLTFVATCNAVSYCGAEPVFVDVEIATLGIDPDSLEQFLNEKTEVRDDGKCWNKLTNKIISACVPVHNFGHPSQLPAISNLCRHYNITVVEDAAESLGSFSAGRHTGTFGSMGIFSFNGNKIITTGGGGMIVTNDEKLAKQAKHRSTTAKIPHPWLFVHDEVGYNYRLPNINAALGCAQLELIEEFVERKRMLADTYFHWFEKYGYEMIREPVESRANYWFNGVLMRDRTERDEFLEFTNKNNVMTRPAWTPMHTLAMYKNCFRTELPTTEWLEERIVNIPSSVPA